MNTFSTWADATTRAFQNAWSRIVLGLPNLLAAIVVLIVGLIIAGLAGSAVRALARRGRLDSAFQRTRLPERFEGAGVHVSLSGFLGGLARWIVILITLSAVADALNWAMLTAFLTAVVAFIPRALVAIAILFVGFVAARFLHDVVEAGVRGSRLPDASASMIAGIVETAVVVFAFMAALMQVGVAADLIRVLFTGIVAAVAISVGLAFGLGGRDKAARWLDQVTGQLGRGHPGGGRAGAAAR